MTVIQDLRELLKVFSILASTETLVLTLNFSRLFWCFNGLEIIHFSDVIGNLTLTETSVATTSFSIEIISSGR